jgi:RNA recognition motif-containing protein
VSGLPKYTAPSELIQHFERFGPLEALNVTTETGKDLGQALISFDNVESAIKASDEMNGSFFVSRLPIPPRRVTVSCDFRGPRIVKEVMLPREPNPRKLIKQIRDKAVGAKWPVDPVMASTNESRMLRRYKTGGLPRSHDRQR